MTTISTFCIAFHIFVAGNHTKIGTWVEHSMSQQYRWQTVPEMGWSRHV